MSYLPLREFYISSCLQIESIWDNFIFSLHITGRGSLFQSAILYGWGCRNAFQKLMVIAKLSVWCLLFPLRHLPIFLNSRVVYYSAVYCKVIGSLFSLLAAWYKSIRVENHTILSLSFFTFRSPMMIISCELLRVLSLSRIL